jgi:O-acetyl-ADP-ribose deacetylase (regulator of RNase III)
VASLEVVRGDLTALEVDAVVNAANPSLLPGGGVCGAIHRAAGPALAQACREAAPCPVGDVRATGGFALRAAVVIHAVGPVWQGGGAGEGEKLASCYRRALEVATELGAASIAFPALSTGIYGYPLRAACRIAVDQVRRFLAAHDRPSRVLLCAYDPATEEALRQEVEATADPPGAGG